MSDRVAVCEATDLAPGERTIVEVNGVEIGVFNIDSEYFALLNTCGHQHGPLCEGTLIPEIEAEYTGAGVPVEETLGEDRSAIRCPWHGWTYDVRTGDHTGDEDESIPTYDVVVDEGQVYVEL
jgi:nitrite reductase/ring-hydroxylating ferredoxin subunit